MDIQKLTCPSCGASLSVPRGASRVTCDYCGNTLGVTLSGKGATLELVQQVAETVAASGESTRSAIEDASQVTQAELRRLQLTQELTATQLQLTNIRGEIRALEREKPSPKVRHQLRELRQREQELKGRIAELEYRLDPSRKREAAVKAEAPRRSWGCAGIVVGLGILLLLGSFGAETSEDSAAMVQLAILTVVIGSLWRIFTKADKPGWAALVPFYNVVVLAEVVGRPWWWVLLLFVPLANLIVLALLAVDLARSFGKGIGFGIGMIFLPFLFFPILAFGDAAYQGPVAG